MSAQPDAALKSAAGRPQTGAQALVARRQPFDSIPAELWDSLVDANPFATPFSRHCVQQAWWAAYGEGAHEETLVVVDPAEPDAIRAIVPLMHRHELEPGDVAARTSLRHQPGRALLAVPDSATAVFFGASYHADYATILTAPDDLPAVCAAVARYLADADPSRWDVIDLRRLKAADPATDALAAAFEDLSGEANWCLTREQEDVCPVLTLPPGADFDGYLGTLDKKERHEIRRKVRRAETSGVVELVKSPNDPEDLASFVDLHQKRWGDDGLFPDTEGGAASRRFFAALADHCAPAGYVELDFLKVAGKTIAAGVILEDRRTVYYYNAGVEPEARELSPGVMMVAAYIQRAIEQGKTRIDFMRGDEPYKYGWGAVDEPIERLLVLRTTDAAGAVPDSKGN